MTSINALRLDRDRGLLLCDEARYWNPEWMIFYTPEKIRSVVAPEVAQELDLVLFMGQTGTSSVGDEFIDRTEKRITRWFEEEKRRRGQPPSRPPSLTTLAQWAFETITEIKRKHVDDYLRGRFGLTARDIITGRIQREGEEISLQDKDLLGEALKLMTFEENPADVKGIFGNSQVLAGHTPEEGFRIFYMTERMPVCEEVQEIFLAQGSGTDTCDLAFCRFANALNIEQRRGNIPPALGLVALLRGLNDAFRLTAGVAGYPKIIFVDGTQPERQKRVKTFFDMHSKLASEIVMAGSAGLLSEDDVLRLIDELIFRDAPFGLICRRFKEAAVDPQRLDRFLRGYPTPPAARGIA
jgi:hypothetical protein